MRILLRNLLFCKYLLLNASCAVAEPFKPIGDDHDNHRQHTSRRSARTGCAQAHELLSEARYVEGSALAHWYQCLVRQVIDHHVSPTDVLPWRVKLTVNCFVDTSARWIEPLELYRYVKAGWLDRLNRWIDAGTNHHRDNINAEAEMAFEEWRVEIVRR